MGCRDRKLYEHAATRRNDDLADGRGRSSVITETDHGGCVGGVRCSDPPPGAAKENASMRGSGSDRSAEGGTERPPSVGCHSVPPPQPTCSSMTARLNAAFVAVGIVVGLVVVSDGAVKPPIQYQDCATIC